MNSLIDDKNEICICGIIIQEVLQGIKEIKDFNRIYSILNEIPFLPTTKTTYIHAANIYRILRLRGITIPTIDVLIASIAIQNNTTLYTLDIKHFSQIAQYNRLSLLK